MNPRFKTGILLFGLILPLVIVGIVIGVISSKKNSISRQYLIRQKNNQVQKQQEMANEQLKIKLSRFDGRKENWEVLLRSTDIGTVSDLLNSETRRIQGMNQNNFSFVKQPVGIGALSQQNSVTFNVSLSGTFSSIQQCLLSLESKMPNLNLNSMMLTPEKDSQLLQAELSYSAWKQ